MMTGNWKIWLIVFVVAIGVLFEVMKSMPGSGLAGWNDSDNLKLDTSHPYTMRLAPGEKRRLTRPPIPKFHVRQMGKQIPPTPPVATGTPGQVSFDHDPAAEKADFEVAVDPKTGKLIKKKKKKKKKKLPTDENEEGLAKDKDSQEPKEKNVVGYNPNSTIEIVSQVPAAEKKEKDEEPATTLDEWIKRLLTHPDIKATEEFIAAHQRGQVTAEIFYTIAEMMVEDSRPDMKQLGVLCAGRVPTASSFQVLATAYNSTTSDTRTREMIEGYVRMYTDISRLPILERVLLNSDTNTVVLGARQVDIASRRYLLKTQASTQQASSDGSTTAASTVDAKAVNAFTRFVPLLESLVKSDNSQIRSEATRTLANLKNLLGPTTPDLAQVNAQNES